MIRVVCCLLIALALAGCATASGDLFNKQDHLIPPKDGSATVVIYRYKQYTGSADKTAIIDNGESVGVIFNGGFMVYETEPGLHRMHTDTVGVDKPVTINIEAGEIYYFRADFQPGWVGLWRLSAIHPEQALEELKSVRSM